MKKPKVTVLMSVFNGGKYLRGAIDSILNQTFKDFEFIIIDDGSTDDTSKIIESYKDKRVKFVQNKKNVGLAKSLNKGIRIAKGKYIARMDADDISLTSRLEKQVKFMDNNLDTAVCGTWLKLFGKDKGIWQVPNDFETLKSLLLFYPVIFHPTAFIRRAFLERYHLCYDESFICAQDYDLWVRIAEKAKISNFGEVLLYHRIHADMVGSLYSQAQIKNANRVRFDLLRRLGIFPQQEEFAVHEAISYWRFGLTKEFVNQVEAWLIKLLKANRERKRYFHFAFSKILVEKWFLVCFNAAGLGWWVWNKFWESPLSKNSRLTLRQKIIFALKCFNIKNKLEQR